MARVKVCIEEETLHNDDGRPIEGIVATCEECKHQTESYGTSPSSVRRCLALLREECPREEANFYVADNGSDED